MNVHKIPHDPGGGYYVNLAAMEIDAAVAKMREAGFSSDLYQSPTIAHIRTRVTSAPRGGGDDYNVRTDIANQISQFATFMVDRVKASCPA